MLGAGWMLVKVESEEYEQALCAFLNSTPGLLQMLNRRARKLTYPKWNPVLWRAVKVPPPDHEAVGGLAEAFRDVKDLRVERLDHLDDCQVRPIIDRAATRVLGVDEADVAQWWRLVAAEPTISKREMQDNSQV